MILIYVLYMLENWGRYKVNVGCLETYLGATVIGRAMAKGNRQLLLYNTHTHTYCSSELYTPSLIELINASNAVKP